MHKNLLKLSSYEYDLPERLIAQTLSPRRDGSRLLVIDKKTGGTSHKNFYNISEYLRPGDCLVLNNTKVIPARLFAVTGGNDNKIEVVLIKRIASGSETWECLTRPGRRTRLGTILDFGNGLRGTVTGITVEGLRVIDFDYIGNFMEIIDKIGIMPLPPYIKDQSGDKNRYQTVYAVHDGSAAAPTAGLHFTGELLESLKQSGVEIAEILLHVGLGTFRPVKDENLENHTMHSEYIKVDKAAAGIINKTKAAGGRIIAIGTTTCRTLESAAGEDGEIRPFEGETDIFIYPPYKFKAVDALVTNFHLPGSTLLMLVSAFAGYDNIMNAYKEAVLQEYRFFSFGDAMLII